MKWNSEQYLKFKNERTQPAIDLISKLSIKLPLNAADIGCGPGNSTAQLKRRFPQAKIVGLDNSEEMLKAARKNYPDIEFRFCDVSAELGSLNQKFDVVFSNACIQWVPDHRRLIKDMWGLLRSGGELAVQIPVNFEEPIHRVISEVSESEKWREKIGTPRHFYTLKPGEYYDILSETFSDFSMWQTVYFHRMKSHKDIMEWYESTGLRPYLEALSPADGKEFEREVFRRVESEYPKQANGEIIFKFPRLFFIAVK